MTTDYRSDYENASGEEQIDVNFRGPDNGRLKLIIVLVAVIGGLVLGFGFVFKSSDQAVNSGPSPMQQQTQMMHEAIQMAKDAQELSRQRMRDMQREMDIAEGRYVETSDEQVQAPE